MKPFFKIFQTIIKIILFPFYLLGFLGEIGEKIFLLLISTLLVFIIFKDQDTNFFIKIMLGIMAFCCFLVAIGKEDKSGSD